MSTRQRASAPKHQVKRKQQQEYDEDKEEEDEYEEQHLPHRQQKKASHVAKKKERKSKSAKLAKRLVQYQALLTGAGQHLNALDRSVYLGKTTFELEFANEFSCPFCATRVDDKRLEDLAANDRYNHYVKCKCGLSFPPVLTAIMSDPVEPFVWLCRMQTRDQFAEWMEGRGDDIDCVDRTTFRDLAAQRPEIYWNALRYVNEDYEIEDWNMPKAEKVVDYLKTFLA